MKLGIATAKNAYPRLLFAVILENFLMNFEDYLLIKVNDKTITKKDTIIYGGDNIELFPEEN